MGFRHAIFRFAAFLPFFIGALAAMDIWRAVRKHGIPPDAPYSSKLLPGLAISAVGGLIGAIYNFLLYVPTAAINSPTGLLCLGMIDISIAIVLLVAVIFQSSYVPGSFPKCKTAATFQAGGGSPGMFSDVSHLLKKSPESTCETFMTIWTLDIVVLILYVLLFALEMYSALHSGHNSHAHNSRVRAVSTRSHSSLQDRFTRVWSLLLWFPQRVMQSVKSRKSHRQKLPQRREWPPVRIQDSMELEEGVNQHHCPDDTRSESWSCKTITCSEDGTATK